MRYLLLALLFFYSSCSAQSKEHTKAKESNELEPFQQNNDPYFVGHQSIELDHGPRTITRNMIQDRNGYYWFATWDGIVGYDGKTFTNYTNKEGLRKFRVFSILEDSQGIIWFGTIGAGIYRYDGEQFQNFTTADGLSDDRVTEIFEDKEGYLWFSTTNGVSKYDRVMFTNFYAEGNADNNDINSIAQDEDGLYYVGTRGKAFTFDGRDFVALKHPEGKSFYNVRRVIKDSEGHIWFGGNDGLWKYNGSELTRIFEKFTGFIYEDKEGNIWTSSEGNSSQEWALSRYNNKSSDDVDVLKSEAGMYFGIMEDNEGNILLGTLNGVYKENENGFVKL